MPLPPLNDWDVTRDSLHRAAQVVGLVRKARIERQPNALHLALSVTPDGLTTGPLSDGSRIELRFAEGDIHGRRGNGHEFALPLAMQTAGGLLADVSGELGVDPSALGPLDSSEATFAVDPALGRDYALVLNTVFNGLARARAHWAGTMTPLVVWPHGFDLSGLWFPGTEPDEQSQPHVNLGFSPGSEGFPRPYVYAYAWPWPNGADSRPLPAPARWYAGKWKGAVLDYDAFRDEADPVHIVAQAAEAFYAALTRS